MTLPRSRTISLTDLLPWAMTPEEGKRANAALDAAEAEHRTLRRFRRTLPLSGLGRDQRWPTDLTRYRDRWLTVGEVTDAALLAGCWIRSRRPDDRLVIDLHTLADALMALRATNDNCRRRRSEPLPRPGARWIEAGRDHVVVARNWYQDAAVGIDMAGGIVAIGPWSFR